VGVPARLQVQAAANFRSRGSLALFVGASFRRVLSSYFCANDDLHQKNLANNFFTATEPDLSKV